MCPEFHRCHAKVILHVFTKERGVGETEQIAYLLDTIVGLLKVITDILKYMFCNPFISGLARLLLTD